MRKLAIFFLFLFFPFYSLKAFEMSAQDARDILDQIFESHVSHKYLTPTIVERAFQVFIEELDPSKCYFVEEDIENWLKPSKATLDKTLVELQEGNFSSFEAILHKMHHAIFRRRALEQEIESSTLDYKDFKYPTTFATNVEELKKRLAHLLTFQTKALAEHKQEVLERIQRKRLLKEEEILGKSPFEKEYFLHTHVIKAVASSLDNHTVYFTPKEAAQFMIQINQRLFGIGVQLQDDLDGYKVVKVIEGSPAGCDKSLQIGDKIIAINGQSIAGIDLIEGVELIRGEEGSIVGLKIIRHSNEENKDQLLDIAITRGEVILKELRNKTALYPYGDGVIAHLSLHTFYQDPFHSSAKDLMEEINSIKKEHKVRGIILDLRINTGGVLPQAVAVAGLFMSKGIVVSIKDNQGDVEHLRNTESKVAWDGPLIVLTSKLSASAAEIVAQTLQDYGRAIVVGDEHTFGKGTFQKFTLDSRSPGKINPKGEFKVTRGLYYTVSGKSPQLTGVKPDIIIQGPTSFMEIGEKYAKYPLDNDNIKESYFDDLSDLPLSQKDKTNWLYRFNLQPRLKTYARFIPILQNNSALRTSQDALYQAYLKAMQDEVLVSDSNQLLFEADFQLRESIEVMKDLIVLLN